MSRKWRHGQFQKSLLLCCTLMQVQSLGEPVMTLSSISPSLNDSNKLERPFYKPKRIPSFNQRSPKLVCFWRSVITAVPVASSLGATESGYPRMMPYESWNVSTPTSITILCLPVFSCTTQHLSGHTQRLCHLHTLPCNFRVPAFSLASHNSFWVSLVVQWMPCRTQTQAQRRT